MFEKGFQTPCAQLPALPLADGSAVDGLDRPEVVDEGVTTRVHHTTATEKNRVLHTATEKKCWNAVQILLSSLIPPGKNKPNIE